MDLYHSLVSHCSPYIYALIYDIDERALIIECVADPKQPEPVKRLVFPNITHYAEVSLLDTPDDESLDDIVDISATETGILITTYKKEILIQTAAQPFAEDIKP